MHLSKSTKLHIVLFSLAVILTAVWNILTNFLLPVRNTVSVSYMVIIILWTNTIYRRILDKRARAAMTVCGLLLASLFLLRLMRYNLAEPGTPFSNFLWYAYYIPFTFIPVLFFLSARYTGDADDGKANVLHIAILAINVILVDAILLNDSHQQMFSFPSSVHSVSEYSYGWLYAVTMVWCLALTVAAVWWLLRLCQMSATRRLMYIPLLIAVFFMSLIIAYTVCGGSPRLYGVSLYNLQEVYAFLYISVWEGCIAIGLIPVNTDYEKIFQISHIGAAIADGSGQVVFASEDFVKKQSASEGGEPTGIILRKEPQKNGYVLWYEDHTAAIELGERLRELTDDLLYENELLEKENELRQERAAFEEKNRLYDRISHITEHTMNMIASLEETGENIPVIACLVAYIKRRANLELLREKAQPTGLPRYELILSVRESMEYLSFLGYSCECVGSDEGTLLPAERLISAYEYVERVIEEIFLSRKYAVSTLAVSFPEADKMLLCLDFVPDEKMSRLLAAGEVSQRTEDETLFLLYDFLRDESTSPKSGEGV